MPNIRLHKGYVITFSGEEGADHSTVVSRLALTLAGQGHRVLVIDADPLSGSTRNLGVDQGPASVWLSDLITSMRGETPKQTFISRTTLPNIDAIPAGSDLAEIEEKLDEQGIDPQVAMMPVIKPLKQHYDFILINTSTDPSNPLTFSSYAASDYAIVVAHPDAHKHIQIAAEEIHSIVHENNPTLRPLGILLNKGHESDLALLKNDAHAADMSLFKTVIRSGEIPETADDYKNLVAEVLRKITQPEN
jgi:chromosome partitioning protein